VEDVEMIDETRIKPSGPRYAVIPDDVIEDEDMPGYFENDPNL
jgi:hypothetical protein